MRLIDGVNQEIEHKKALEGLDRARVRKEVLKGIVAIITGIVAVILARVICHNYPEICRIAYWLMTGQN